MQESNTFLGRGWGFPPTFEKGKKGVEMLSNEEDIKSSLEILLSTNIGDRQLQPSYGCDLSKLLFEPLDASLKTYVKDLINDAVLYHEPRIKLDDVILETNELEGAINIDLQYTILTTNTRYNLVYPFYLKEGTNINP